MFFIFFIPQMSFSSGPPVCKRSPGVRKAIERELDKKCEEISETDLLKILKLYARKIKKDLKRGDLLGLNNLMELRLSDGELTKFPMDIFKLPYLFRLNLEYNKIVSIPKKIGELVQLEELGLDSNQIVEIPESLGKLKLLKKLYLRSNQLQGLPSVLSDLPVLEVFDFSFNPLRSLPASLDSIPLLKALTFQGVPKPLWMNFKSERFVQQNDKPYVFVARDLKKNPLSDYTYHYVNIKVPEKVKGYVKLNGLLMSSFKSLEATNNGVFIANTFLSNSGKNRLTVKFVNKDSKFAPKKISIGRSSVQEGMVVNSMRPREKIIEFEFVEGQKLLKGAVDIEISAGLDSKRAWHKGEKISKRDFKKAYEFVKIIFSYYKDLRIMDFGEKYIRPIAEASAAAGVIDGSKISEMMRSNVYIQAEFAGVEYSVKLPEMKDLFFNVSRDRKLLQVLTKKTLEPPVRVEAADGKRAFGLTPIFYKKNGKLILSI